MDGANSTESSVLIGVAIFETGDVAARWPSVRRSATMSVELFAFRYRDPLTGRWVNARYKATRDEIAARHVEWEIIDAAEVRGPIDGVFNPHRVDPLAVPRRLQEPSPQINPHLERPPAVDAIECFLTLVFLRRYVAYCARRRRFAQMDGAARLHREVVAARRALS